MSRTIKEIYDAIIDEKETFSSLDTLVPNPDDSQTFLDDLTSTSKVGIWRLIFWVTAVAIWTLENLFDIHSDEIDDRKDSLIPGTLRWYVNTVLEFQDGDELVWNEITEKYEYAATDLDAQIVEQAAAVESNGEVLIKVAKSDGGTGLEALSAAEEGRLETYINQIKFAGTITRLINDSADLLHLEYTVYIDPLLIYNDETNPSDSLNGSLLSDATTFPIEDAITDYIQTLDFNGIFRVMELTDAIQAATGVKNVIADTVEAKYGALSYTDVLALTNESYNANAGYLSIDPSYPLADNITYLNFST